MLSPYSEWTSVVNSLPEPWEPVLVYTADDEMAVAYFDDGSGEFFLSMRATWHIKGVTHWAPIPAGPVIYDGDAATSGTLHQFHGIWL